MNIQEVLQFLQNALDAEFTCRRAKHDLTIDDLSYETISGIAQKYFHRVVPNLYGRGRSISRIIGDPEWEESYKQNYAATLRRTVFQIRHYQSPIIGEILREKMKTDELWGCLCSYHIDNGQDIDISRMYFVAETDEGLKIVYDWGFEQDKHTWRQTHDHLPSRVEHAGKLLEVLNLQPPVEPASLQEYLHPTHTAIVIDN